MKRTCTRVLRSALSLVLVFCLALSLCGAAFAAESNEINYVSIGDSMTNGYGFVGYNQDEHKAGYDFKNGTGVYGDNAYPLLFEEYLENQGYEVDHTKLALSALRVENLRYLLGIIDSEPVDGYDAYDGYAGEGVSKAELRTIYQTAMKEADVISLALGNASFNAFFFDRVMKVFGNIDSWDEDDVQPTLDHALAMVESEEQKQVVREVYNLLKGELVASIPSEMAEQFKLEELCDLAAYTTASFLLSMESVIEWIGENNEDAEVILIGVLNSTSGMSIVGDGWEFDLGSAMDAVYGAINAYTAALPTVMQMTGEYENVKFYYADQPSNPEMISVKIPALAEADWGVVEGIDGDLVRSKTDNAYNSIVVDDIASSMGLVRTTETAIAGVEDAVKNENATVGSILQSYGGAGASAIVYLGLENAIVESMKSSAISLEAIGTFAGDGLMTVFSNAPMEYFDTETQQSKDTCSVSEAVGAFTDFFCEEDMLNLVRLFAVSKVGDGISAHPTPATHKDIAASVIAAYGNHTAKDETIENVEVTLEALYDVLVTYGPEVAAEVWAQWEEYGYVESVETTMTELKEMLDARYTYYTETALPAIETAVGDLAAQKDVLCAELDTLKAELEAKKAELEKVISEQEIGSVTLPDISIDIELGNNEQTEVPENECLGVIEGASVEAELEAAIADLEHAIAVIEALITDIEADIADMVALAEQIAAAVAELEKTMADIAAAAEDLAAAVEAAIAVLQDNDGIVDAVISSFDAARATVLAANDVLELTLGVAEEITADIDVMIEKIAVDAEALYNKFITELPGCIEQIPEEGMMLIGGAIMAAQMGLEEGKALIETKLTEELTALEAEYGMSEEEIEAELTALAAEYGITEESINAKLDEIYGEIEAEVNARYAEIEAQLIADIAALEAEAQAQIEALEAEKAALEAQLAEAAEDAIEGIQAQIDRVTGDIATVNEDLACAIEHLEAAAETAYNEIVAEVEAAYNEAIAALEAELAELKAAYDEAVAALEAELAALKEAYDKAVEELTAAADKAIADLTAKVEEQLAELGKIGEDLGAIVDGIYAEIHDELEAAQAAIEEILKGNLDAIEDLKNALVDLGAEAVIDVVESIIAQIEAMFEEATTDDYVITPDSYYVALGDGSAETESYVEELAAYLGIECNNLAANGQEMADAYDVIAANAEDIAAADLITIGYSNSTFVGEAFAAIKDGADLDWSTYVTDAGVVYVEDALAEISAELAANGITGDYNARAMAAIEAYAYSSVAYACNLPGVVSAIRAVNEDAVVIIVGQHNAFTGTTLAFEGVEIDLGEYVDYLVTGAAVHGIAYCMITGDAIYVEAPDAATDTPAVIDIWTLAELMYDGISVLYPNATGDLYIRDKILNALNITTAGLLGDANSDGVVNTLDARLILLYNANPENTVNNYDINLSVCDVSGDGVINTIDARWILMYNANPSTVFPAA